MPSEIDRKIAGGTTSPANQADAVNYTFSRTANFDNAKGEIS